MQYFMITGRCEDGPGHAAGTADAAAARICLYAWQSPGNRDCGLGRSELAGLERI